MSYDYPGIHLFDKPFPNEKITIREMLTRMGPDIDTDRFIHSGQGEALLNSYKLQIKYADGMNPRVVECWDDFGVIKEEHDKGMRTRWFSYVPHGALDQSSARLYPLIINLPHDPFVTEGRGYAQLAAGGDVIVIMPTVTDIEDIYTLYTEVLTQYNIDKTRVYMTGFSFAGFRALAFAMRHPEALAGIAVNCHLWPYIWQLPEKWIRDHLAEIKMPMINYTGNVDFGHWLPLNKGFCKTDTPNGGDHVHSAQDSLDRVNLWLGINGCPQITLESALEAGNSANKWEREIGLPICSGETKVIDGTEYHFGDFISNDGVCRTRIIAMDNVPHIEFGSMAEVAWDFLKGFSR